MIFRFGAVAGAIIISIIAGVLLLISISAANYFKWFPGAWYDGEQLSGPFFWAWVDAIIVAWSWDAVILDLKQFLLLTSDHVFTVSFALGVFLTLLAIFFFTSIWLKKKGHKIRESLNEVIERKTLTDKTGLFEYWPSANPKNKQLGLVWDRMSGRILQNPQSSLDILGANGWDTFGSQNSPLHKAVGEFTGTIRIILLCPRSEHLKTRSKSVSMNPNTYNGQIKKSMRFLKTLKDKGAHVHVRFYDSIPNWKLIFTPRTVWVQHYHNNSHVIDCPVYLFYCTDDGKGLYNSFSKDFNRVWELTKDDYDFSSDVYKFF